MRGPIDFIVVGFPGNNFKGEVLDALSEAMDNGAIDVLDMAVISKDEEGMVVSMELENIDNAVVREVISKKGVNGLVTAKDVVEVGDLLENNNSAGLLIVEQLWAKPLKQALINENCVLISEGRIHPDASTEIK